MGITDFIGGRGEAIAFARLARVCRTNADVPYFWPHYLGEKCESFDFLVELVDAGDKTVFLRTGEVHAQGLYQKPDAAAAPRRDLEKGRAANGFLPGADLRGRRARGSGARLCHFRPWHHEGR